MNEADIVAMTRRARVAGRKLGILSTEVRDKALNRLADLLESYGEEILSANALDVARAEARGLKPALVDRLRLTPARMLELARSVREIVALPDPVGELVGGWTRPNGLEIQEVRVPLGVVGIIYESRPNVTIDVTALCLKSANAVVLKGGSDALESNRALVRLVQRALADSPIPLDACQLLDSPDRDAVKILLAQEDSIDVIIPRGGEGLIREVAASSRIPVIKQYKGVCHLYVAPDASPAAVDVVVNAKCQRPGTCNALETLLVDADCAAAFLPKVASALLEQGVQLRGCPEVCARVPEALPATEEDWDTEYLELILSIRVVSGLDAAIDHIHAHGSGHSEGILTESVQAARRFQREIDAACVYVNASTRLTDGGQFGFGAEVGISTGKLHARGPMGLRDLTTRKYLCWGDNTLRR